MGKGWISRNAFAMKTAMRVIFGIVWIIVGVFKFGFDTPQLFPQLIHAAGQGQPQWLLPWFSFWFNVVSQNPAFWVYLIGIGEILLGLGLVLGAMRKITYTVGFFFSLLLWSIPEGLGGPYGPGSTDIGGAIIYSFVFLMLMIFNATYGTSKYSVDNFLEKHIKWWKKIAEFD